MSDGFGRQHLYTTLGNEDKSTKDGAKHKQPQNNIINMATHTLGPTLKGL